MSTQKFKKEVMRLRKSLQQIDKEIGHYSKLPDTDALKFKMLHSNATLLYNKYVELTTILDNYKP